MAIELSTAIVNGYFYQLQYNISVSKMDQIGIDPYPLIYCIRPDIANINYLWGLNFHHLPNDSIRALVYNNFAKYYNLDTEPKKRQILSDSDLLNIYSGFTIAARCYDRKKVIKCYKVSFDELPKLLRIPATLLMSNEKHEEAKFNLAPGNKGF